MGGIQCLTSWYDEVIVTFLSWDVWFKCATYCWCTFFELLCCRKSIQQKHRNGRMVLWFQRTVLGRPFDELDRGFYKNRRRGFHFLKVPTVTTKLNCMPLKTSRAPLRVMYSFQASCFRGYVKFRGSSGFKILLLDGNGESLFLVALIQRSSTLPR